MKVLNMHSRIYPVDRSAIEEILLSLASEDDRLWPHEKWPAMQFDRPLEIDAKGGHRPIRYVVQQFDPKRFVEFRFVLPKGFLGTHSFEILSDAPGKTELKHTIDMETKGSAVLIWPLVIRPLHDALIKDALDKVSGGLGLETPLSKWSIWVRLLRWSMSGRG